MKTLFQMLFVLGLPSICLASSSNPTTDMNLLMMAFIGFGTCILIVQLVPASIMFFSMIKGLFSVNEIQPVKGE